MVGGELFCSYFKYASELVTKYKNKKMGLSFYEKCLQIGKINGVKNIKMVE
jgi:hypothetical protein